MHIKTQAIVLNTFKHGDSGLIVKLLTLENGMVSFIAKNALKTKKGKINASFFRLGSILQVDYNYRASKNLQFLTELKLDFHLKTLQNNILKISVLTFLCEVLNQVLLTEEDDPELFFFLKESLIWLDENEEFSLFHCAFLLKLTNYLGCYPNIKIGNYNSFDLETGNFENNLTSLYAINLERLYNFKLILGIKFDELKELKISKQNRKLLLQDILDYYNFHVSGYKMPKSLAVLEQIFN